MSADVTVLDSTYSGVPFVEVYPNFPLETLPDWLSVNIGVALVYGADNKCVVLPDGRKYHLDNRLNEKTGRDWTLFINSVFNTRYPTNGTESYAHSIRRVHPSPKPPQLMRDLIEFFTKKEGLVFDCFAGVGGTLLGAALCGRKAVGIELNKKYIAAYEQAAIALNLERFPIICGDSVSLLADNVAMQNLLGGKEISLMLIDPPYSNMMNKPKTGGDAIAIGNDAPTPFTTDNRDLGNMPRVQFLDALKETVNLALRYIKFRGYVIVFIKDIQPSKKEINFLHAEVVNKINEISNVYYKGMKIWADNSAKMYPYGYPFSFVANQIHQYILVFRKEK
ncbi:MAG: site-specific DNA-methyltransferase [Oscillospiraceae bacterium]|jgi:tRNA G10  N-methylase Trm11|nr:site-specific DNA-methyltransferase [Oscillospiraceae bacterium]